MKFLIEEEYGYRFWVWQTNKSYPEMIEWWTSLETVDDFFFNPSKTLPFGDVSSLPEECNQIPDMRGYIHLHMDEDSYMVIDKETFHHKGYCPYEFQ